jgi:hypothetical protein
LSRNNASNHLLEIKKQATRLHTNPEKFILVVKVSKLCAYTHNHNPKNQHTNEEKTHQTTTKQQTKQTPNPKNNKNHHPKEVAQ